MLVLDFSKLLVSMGVHGVGVATAAIAGGEWLSSRKNAEARLEKIVRNWKLLLHEKLTDEQREILERKKPGVVAEMKQIVSDLEDRLAWLSLNIESASYWERLWPYSSTASAITSVAEAFQEANRDLMSHSKATTRCLFENDPVTTILEADAAAVTNASAIEMSILQGDATLPSDAAESPRTTAEATQPSAMASQVAGVSPSRSVPPDVLDVYRSAVATTAALVPPLFRGSSRRALSDSSPV
ncbi:hypothetical protein NUW54_g2045 [Trametes sanguinea]|uniref:Uncharacterized protein n=1 Tax=Trametes sanguinea TaxID=158606 RepID=A0ACC1Q4N2_9APHY|nr:hypothetical protein NUW54_g2045 [Trametes sanguinea]